MSVLENIYGAAFDQITATPALHLALPGRDPDASGGSHLVHTAHLVVPVTGSSNQAMWQSVTPRAKAIASATVCHVRITAMIESSPNGFPHLLDACDVFLWGPSTHFKLRASVARLRDIQTSPQSLPCDTLPLRIISANDDGLQPGLRCRRRNIGSPAWRRVYVPQDHIKGRKGPHHGVPFRRDRGTSKMLFPDRLPSLAYTPQHVRKQLFA